MTEIPSTMTNTTQTGGTMPTTSYTADALFNYADALATALWNQAQGESDPAARNRLFDLYQAAADIRGALDETDDIL